MTVALVACVARGWQLRVRHNARLDRVRVANAFDGPRATAHSVGAPA